MTSVTGELSSGWPWWASLLVALTWLAFYICRVAARYRLLSKALDKVPADRVPEVAVFIDRRQALPRRVGSAGAVAPSSDGDDAAGTGSDGP